MRTWKGFKTTAAVPARVLTAFVRLNKDAWARHVISEGDIYPCLVFGVVKHSRVNSDPRQRLSRK